MRHLSVPQMLLLKLGVVQLMKFTPKEFCEPGLTALTISGYGPAIWNIGVMLGSGPASLPVIAGIVYWLYMPWYESSKRTCENPWSFEPLTIFPSNFDGFNNKNPNDLNIFNNIGDK